MNNPASPNSPDGNRAVRFEFFALIGAISFFFVLNFFTAEKTPAVWVDEVMYQDPAVNLFQGHGFTSGAWFAQDMEKFWAGNVPLYQFVLFGWLKLFGFSLQTVRSFHYTLVSLAVMVGWLAILRLNLISSRSGRLLFCLLICLCSSATYVYRSARPESWGMLLLAFSLLSFTFRPRGLSFLMLLLSGILLTWSGLQLALYTGLTCGLVLIWGPSQLRLQLIVLCLGCGLGGVLLFAFYQHFGVWDDFVTCIRHFTVANQTQFANALSYGSGLTAKLKQVPKLFTDYSFYPMFILALGMAWGFFRHGGLRWRSPLCFGLVASLAIPLAMHAIGVFPLYYFWMAFFPLTLGVCAELSNGLAAGRSQFFKVAMAGLLILACLAGLPRRLLVASFEWQGRSYEPVMKLTAPYVSRDKLVFTSFPGYYAARQEGARVVTPNHISVLSEAEKARVSVAIAGPDAAAFLKEKLGGEWRQVGEILKPKSARPLFGLHEALGSSEYNLTVFERH